MYYFLFLSVKRYIKKETGGDKMEHEEEFANLYILHYNSVYRYISSVTKNNALTEDVVQDTFLEAWKQFELLREHPNIAGWLIRTACYKLRNLNKKLHRTEIIPLTDSTLQSCREEHGYEIRELGLVLKNIFTKEEQLLFKRYYLSGYTAKEIAALECITENNVRVRISRLTRKLRNLK